MNTSTDGFDPILLHRIDDIPLLVAVIRAMQLDTIFDEAIPTHGNTMIYNALTNGEALCLWLVYLLSQGDHRKWKVEHWVAQQGTLLTALWGSPVPASDFTDDRLTTVLSYLARPPVQEAIDRLLCAVTIALYQLVGEHIRLDATVLSGYHRVVEQGVMQYGHRKGDADVGCTQWKLMAAATPTGQYLTGQAHAGNRADDPLYVPLLTRLFRWPLPVGMLFVGDSKMGALSTRRHIVAHQHHYYMPLSEVATPAADRAQWIQEAVDGSLVRFGPMEPIFRDDVLLGYGYAFTREQSSAGVTWRERVQVIRSLGLVEAGRKTLDRHLRQARKELMALTPPPKQRVKQYTEEAAFQQAITQILQRYHVESILRVETVHDATSRTKQEQTGRYVVMAVHQDADAYREQVHACGWRIYVTSAPPERLSLAAGQLMYRQGAGQGVERMNRLLKDHETLGLDRLYVSHPKQIVGLGYLVTLAQRIQMYIESRIRQSLADQQEELPDYYPGGKSSAKPTTKTMFEPVCTRGVTLVEIDDGCGQRKRYLTALPNILVEMLRHLHLSVEIYHCLIE